MALRAFDVRIYAALGVGLLGVGAWVALGTRSALALSRDSAAMDAVGARAPAALMELRASEKTKLEEGPLPIEKAMADVAIHGRPDARGDLAPQPSTDKGPLEGWAFRQHEVPAWLLATPPIADAGDAQDAEPTKPTK